MREYMRNYYINNKDKIREHQKEYYTNNKDKIKEHQKEHQEYHKTYYTNNKDRLNTNSTIYQKEWRKQFEKPLVYCYKDLDNEIVYVGSTKNLYKRLSTRKCKASKGYFDKVYKETPEHFTLEIVKEFDVLKDARNYESMLIKTLHPKYNIQGNKKPDET